MMLRAIVFFGFFSLFCQAAGADEWGQVGHDAARSGASADGLHGPFSRKWYRLFADEGLQSGVQPVVAGGRVYIGTLRGKLHAIDVQSGKDAWVYYASGPILHTVAVDGGRVFVGTTVGLEAVKVANGLRAWERPVHLGMWSAPAVANGRVYAAFRGGEVICLNEENGQAIWSSDLGHPILNSPAVDVKAGRVYVGCEDMHVYALDAASGAEVWKSPKLPGVSFRGYYPVIAPDGSVMVTVTPCAGGDAMQEVLLDMTKEVFGQFSSWRIKSEAEKQRIRSENFELMKKPQTYQKQLDYLRKRLTDEPALQTFFVLDPATGRQRFVAPIVYAESMNGPAMPPVVSAEGKVIVKFSALLRSRYEHYSPFLNVGYLDTKSGFITPIMDQRRTYGWYESLLLVHDEQSQLSLAGKMLINAHQDNVNALDLSTLEGSKQPWANGVHEVKEGVAAAIWAKVLHAKEGEQVLAPGWEWLPRGTAVYGGGSAIDVPVTIAGDSFYFLPTHEISAGVALVAYKMDPNGKSGEKGPAPTDKLTAADAQKIRELHWDWDTLEMPRLNLTLSGLPQKVPGTRQNPLTEEAKARVQQITDRELDRIIQGLDRQNGASSAVNPPPVQTRLDRAVPELISTQWRPLLFPAGKAPAEAYRLFTEPTETLYTLSLAYPHLSSAVQAKVVQYVQEQSRPGGSLEGPIGRHAYDNAAGEIRSAYDEAPAKLLKMGNDVVRSETARIYPFYLWARVSGDWSHFEAHWDAMKKLINPKAAKNEADLGNGRISGLIAACRVAAHMRDKEALATLLPQARSAIRERLVYEFAHTEGGVITTAGNRSLFGRWRFLSPELAGILRKYTAGIHEHLMEDYVDYHRPAWFVAWNTELLWRNESPFSFPMMSNEIFGARAMILGARAQTLEKYVDLPWCKGDECYIQKLALLAEARD